MIEFGEWLRGQRGQRSTYQVEVETRGRGRIVRPDQVSRAERGVTIPKVETLRRLCDYYGGDLTTAIILRGTALSERERKRARKAA